MAFLGAQDNALSWIFQLVWIVFFVIFMFYGQRLQTTVWLKEIASSLSKLKLMRDKGRKIAISTIQEIGKPDTDPSNRIDRFLEHVDIGPVGLDPAGVINRLEHLIDVRDNRFKDEVKLMAPQADKVQINNLENILEVAMALNQIYKIIRHFYLLGKKTLSIYYIMQLQMIMPMIMKQSKAFASALTAFTLGQPIGDGVGALVAAKLMYKNKQREIAKDIVMGETTIENRTVYVLKAVGPGGNIGKPGEAIKKVLEEKEGNIKMIIIIDAALKLEGEKIGEVIEGIGVAIGGPGVEKYKVEEAIVKYKVPINAILIKEDFGDAVSTMRKEIPDGAEAAIKSVKRLIREKTKEGDSLIIAGIGNTMGVGQ